MCVQWGDASAYPSPVSYLCRWVASCTRSEHANAVEWDPFTVTILTCTTDTVALTNGGAGRTEFYYTFGSTEATDTTFAISTTHGTGSDSCPMSMTCEFYDAAADAWYTPADPPLKACDASGVTVELEDTDANFADFSPGRAVPMRITYTSDESQVADAAGRVVVDEFDVAFVQ